jgi:hypothetical protein
MPGCKINNIKMKTKLKKHTPKKNFKKITIQCVTKWLSNKHFVTNFSWIFVKLVITLGKIDEIITHSYFNCAMKTIFSLLYDHLYVNFMIFLSLFSTFCYKFCFLYSTANLTLFENFLFIKSSYGPYLSCPKRTSKSEVGHGLCPSYDLCPILFIY